MRRINWVGIAKVATSIFWAVIWMFCLDIVRQIFRLHFSDLWIWGLGIIVVATCLFIFGAINHD